MFDYFKIVCPLSNHVVKMTLDDLSGSFLILNRTNMKLLYTTYSCCGYLRCLEKLIIGEVTQTCTTFRTNSAENEMTLHQQTRDPLATAGFLVWQEPSWLCRRYCISSGLVVSLQYILPLNTTRRVDVYCLSQMTADLVCHGVRDRLSHNCSLARPTLILLFCIPHSPPAFNTSVRGNCQNIRKHLIMQLSL